MIKPLKEEQADMRNRWSDPAYRWANDPELRRKLAKEFRNVKSKPSDSTGEQRTSKEAPQGARGESEGN